jgi:hypothetical protein
MWTDVAVVVDSCVLVCRDLAEGQLELTWATVQLLESLGKHKLADMVYEQVRKGSAIAAGS